MRRKKIVFLLVALLLVFSLASCKHIIVTTLGTLKDVLIDVEKYEERLNELTKDKEDNIFEDESSVLDYEHRVDGLLYKREDLVEHLGTFSERDNQSYSTDELLNARDFITNLKLVIMDNEKEKAGEDIHIDNETYNITVTLDGSLIVHYTYQSFNTIFKIKIYNSNLHIECIQYNYDETTYDPLSEGVLDYEYYNYLQDQYIVEIDMNNEEKTMTYASFENGTYYIISNEEKTIEEELKSTYSVDYYDSESKSLRQYRIEDFEIQSESINVYDSHAIAYQYIDYDLHDDESYLRVNFVNAEGYDYILTPAYDGPSSSSEGIYDNEGNILYQDDLHFSYNVNQDKAQAFITMNINVEELSEEHFTLSNYGLSLESEVANYSTFSKNRIHTLEDLSKELKLRTLDFFSENIEVSSYSYIDADIKEKLLYFYNPTAPVKVNDSTLFKSDMARFLSNLEVTNQLVINENSSVEETNMDATTYIDLGNEYYHAVSSDSINHSKSYLIRDIEDELWVFVQDEDLRNRHYHFDESFTSFIDSRINLKTPLENISEVEEVETGKYKVKADINLLDFMSYRLFEDKEYSRYLKSEVEAVITFNDDHTSYTVEFTVTGILNLSGEQSEVVYEGTRTYSIETFELYNPVEDDDYEFSLAWKEEDIIFTSSIGDIYNFEITIEGERWIELELTPGAYTVSETKYDERLNYIIYNSEGEIISNQKEFNVDESGLYYMKLTSSIIQEVTISVIESDFDIAASEELNFITSLGIIDTSISDEKYFTIAQSDERRILKLTIDEETSNCSFEDMFTLKLVPDDLYEEREIRYISGTVSSYYYLEPNVNYYIKASAISDQIHIFYYELINLPEVDEVITDIYLDTLYEHPDVYLTPLQNEVKIHFTVSVKPLDTLMSINTYFRESSFDIKLFKENGEELDFVSYLDLPPGNYYFQYSIESEDQVMIISTSFDDLN